MSYQVRLEVFEGPFDLLLHLIARRRVDVAEVDLADITADFLATLGGLAPVDLDTASRFLVVAATLIELKAARLLPTTTADEYEDDLGAARDLLYARLLEYRAFRDAAAVLRSRWEHHARHVGRSVGPDPDQRRPVPRTPLGVGADRLALLAARATSAPPEPTVDLTHIRRTVMSLQAAVRLVLDRLGHDEPTAFETLAAGRSRSDRVVVFLALLELYKLGTLDLDQPDHRGVLTVRRLAPHDDVPTVVDVATA